jgi:hypothetical protein
MGFPADARESQSESSKIICQSVQGGVSHFGYMLPNLEEYERVIASVGDFDGRLLMRCEHGGMFSHTYLADPDGYAVEIHYGG